MFGSKDIVKELVVPTRYVTNYNIVEGSNIGVLNHEVTRLLKLGWQPCAGVASGTKSGKVVWVQAMVQYGN